MKNKQTFGLCVLLCLTVYTVHAQLNIEECYEKARANYPLVRQYDLISKANDYTVANVSKAWLPQAQLSVRASYQSAVTELPVDFSRLGIPGLDVPRMRRDQYGATLDVSQLVFDGGAVAARRDAVRAQSIADENALEVQLYALRERIQQLFFGILLCDAMKEQNELFRHELQVNRERIMALIESGLAGQPDADAIEAELLRVEQLLTQVASRRRSFLEMLSAFTGEPLHENTVLQKPAAPAVLPDKPARPEFHLYDAQLAALNIADREITAGLMPRLGIFLTGGYGNPGLNMLKNEFAAYYIGGVRLQWNLGEFHTYKNRRQLVETNRHRIELQRETFLFHTALNRSSYENEVRKYRELLMTDDRIIALRYSVRMASEQKMQSGTLSGTDLVRDMTAEQLARQDRVLHEIELLQAIYGLKFTLNN